MVNIPPYTWDEIRRIPDEMLTPAMRVYKEVLSLRLADPEQDTRGEAEDEAVEATEAILKILEEAK